MGVQRNAGWSLGRSAYDPLTESGDGFSETLVDGEIWRVYAVANADLGMRVLVGDNMRVRDRLVEDVIRGLRSPRC